MAEPTKDEKKLYEQWLKSEYPGRKSKEFGSEYLDYWRQYIKPYQGENLASVYAQEVDSMLNEMEKRGEINAAQKQNMIDTIGVALQEQGYSPSLPYWQETIGRMEANQQKLAGEYAASIDPARQKFLKEGPLPDYLTAGGSTEGAPKAWWSPQQLQAGQTDRNMANRNMYDEARVAARDDWRSQQQEVLNSPEMRAPENWIQSWFIKNTPEPNFSIGKPWYGMTPGERGYEMANTEYGSKTEEMLRAGYTNLEAFARAGGTPGPMPVGEPTAPKHYAPEPVQPPATPDWLSLLFPQLQAGQPVKPLKNVRTPSSQQWGNLTPTQQAMASGFLGWSGQKYGEMPSMADLMADMQKRIPKTPYGAGYKNWGMSRQYA
uniref:Uncharacterized protein n=1 Tax=viral metagenome TaxID=1070528 RepID=A0A6M3KTJ3_9ZZZZ